MARPTERNDDSFWMLAGGKIDHDRLLSDHEEFVKFAHKASNRDDFKIGEIIAISEYRYTPIALPFDRSAHTYLC